MKTTRFLAGPPDICAHLGSGEARDKSLDPPTAGRYLTFNGQTETRSRHMAKSIEWVAYSQVFVG